ncbi:zf-Tim10-DDP domain-containing protein [Mycena chlorophos]|uniref:Mitochondrial import inner membrane translocase subunit n=1 Tax=Mycena chlorophos TaxID=658473 RepID=A0A8H6WGM4_MYCCL|nr:zf-Tim10-DDP domain-containing protein [Mycena chlorophos]
MAADFFGGGSKSSPQDNNARKEAIMDNVRNELALANAQQLMNARPVSANERCFKACVLKPSTSLSNSEQVRTEVPLFLAEIDLFHDQTCLSRCLDRYMEAFTIVQNTYMARIRRERMEDTSRVL